MKRKYMPFTEDEKKLNDFSKRSVEFDIEMMGITSDMRTKLSELSELQTKRSICLFDFEKQFEGSFHTISLPGQSMSDRNDMLNSIRDAFSMIDLPYTAINICRFIEMLNNQLDKDERNLSAKWVTKEFCVALTKYENRKASESGQQNMSICPFGDQTASGSTIKSNRLNSKSNENMSLVPRRVHKNPVESLDEWNEHITSTGRKYYYNKATNISQWDKPKKMANKEKKKSGDMLASTSTDKIKPMTSTSIYSKPSGSTTRANPSNTTADQDSNTIIFNPHDKIIKKLCEKPIKQDNYLKELVKKNSSSLKRFNSSGSKIKRNAHKPETKVNIDKNFNGAEGLDMFYVKLKIIFTFLGLFYVSMILFV